MPLMYPICGQVFDVDGTLWDVRDVRTTKHGFDLCFGTPADDHGAYRGGLPRLIATAPLRKYWEDTRTNGDAVIFDLPAGRTTLKRVRRRLGFNFVLDRRQLWATRAEDLAILPIREFAQKHRVMKDVAFAWRRRLTGNQPSRETGWWRKPRYLKILLADTLLKDAARKLGISTSHTHRLRLLAHEEEQRQHIIAERKAGRLWNIEEILARINACPDDVRHAVKTALEFGDELAA